MLTGLSLRWLKRRPLDLMGISNSTDKADTLTHDGPTRFILMLAILAVFSLMATRIVGWSKVL